MLEGNSGGEFVLQIKNNFKWSSRVACVETCNSPGCCFSKRLNFTKRKQQQTGCQFTPPMSQLADDLFKAKPLISKFLDRALCLNIKHLGNFRACMSHLQLPGKWLCANTLVLLTTLCPVIEPAGEGSGRAIFSLACKARVAPGRTQDGIKIHFSSQQ